jgi:hypothetical protein
MKTMLKVSLSLFACTFFCAGVFGEYGNHLFKIERSKNANIVQYDVNIVDGKIDADNPIDSYWVLLAEDGSTENITALQRKAYGYRANYNEASGQVDFTLNPVKSRPMKVYLVDGAPKAEITINGKPAFLQTVYVDSTDRFTGIPKVNYYVLTGTDVKTGTQETEKIDVN